MLTKIASLVLLASLISAQNQNDGKSLPKIEKKIAVGDQTAFDHLAIDLKGNRLFITSPASKAIEVIDLKEGKKCKTIADVPSPKGVVYIPEYDALFAACGDGSCNLYDGKTYELRKSVKLAGNGADNVAYDAVSHVVYVVHDKSSIAGIDLEKFQPVFDLKAGADAEGIILDKSGKHIYACIEDDSQIAVVDIEKKSVSINWDIAVGKNPVAIAADQKSGKMIVGCRKPASAAVFDIGTGKEVASVKGLSNGCDNLFYDEDAHRVYISCGSGFLDVLAQTESGGYDLAGKITTAPGAKTCIFVPELKSIFVAVPEVPKKGNPSAEVWVYKVD